ncbi:hypothetical protein PHISCL_04481 [Aspergillus sclerotialis]|uniref:Methyltransferase domain-containing protein n=1 Tax=Aspergillus sclerotialis TaxID=2070753 RepID=A0A3A2ZV59_9EURO|nr:hypothetical protein PHISCL_04481 [Aspergillus sclerotialis]
MGDIDFFYDSPYRAELYDLQWNSPNLPDMDVYWKGFADLLAQHGKSIPQNRPFTLLDVGTGTGRILLGLLKKAAATSLDTSTAKFIGMDNAPPMLDLAVKNAAKEQIIPPVTWVVGSATALHELSPIRQQGITVDLLIFSFSSICHLRENGELKQFFESCTKVLTPGTGRAYISFVDGLLQRPGTDVASEFPPFGDPVEIRSLAYPGVWYREENDAGKFKGDILFMTNRMKVFKKLPEGGEEVLESHSGCHQLRRFSEAEVLEALESVGLRIVDTLRSDMMETYLVLQLPE